MIDHRGVLWLAAAKYINDGRENLGWSPDLQVEFRGPPDGNEPIIILGGEIYNATGMRFTIFTNYCLN